MQALVLPFFARLTRTGVQCFEYQFSSIIAEV
jgi:hypothetical protein